MLNTYIYHSLHTTCFGVCYTIFREIIALLAQELYAFCSAVTQVVLQDIKYALFEFTVLVATFKTICSSFFCILGI